MANGIAVPQEGDTLRYRIWFLQILSNMVGRSFTSTADRFVAILRGVVLIISGFMLTYPVIVFVGALDQAALIISPPLVATFAGGLTGLALSNAQRDDVLRGVSR